MQLKSIRDGPHNPTSQNFGTFVDHWAKWDREVLTKLARGCVIEGHDRKKICAINAEVGYSALSTELIVIDCIYVDCVRSRKT